MHNKEALPSVRRYSRWVPAVRGRKQLNKEELSLRATMDLVGPSRQALHVQSSSDDSRMLTTRAPSAPRRWTTVRPQTGTTRRWGRRGSGVADGEEWETRLVRCEVGLDSAENNRRCGVEGWPGHRRGSVSLRHAKQRHWMPEDGAGGPDSAGGRR